MQIVAQKEREHAIQFLFCNETKPPETPLKRLLPFPSKYGIQEVDIDTSDHV